jgi:hypothetical protein
MRSRRVSLRVPWPLDDAMKKVCTEEEYENLNACWLGAGIRFVQDSRRRHWVRLIANAKATTKDYLLNNLLSFPTDIKAMMERLKRLDKK